MSNSHQANNLAYDNEFTGFHHLCEQNNLEGVITPLVIIDIQHGQSVAMECKEKTGIICIFKVTPLYCSQKILLEIIFFLDL